MTSFGWWVLRAHWAFGLLPLAFLTGVSRPALAAAGAAFLAGAALDRAGAERASWQRRSAPVILLLAGAAAADLAAGSRDLLSSVALLILGVQAVKFLLPKRAADGWQLCAVSFLEFLASAASTSEMTFAAFLFVYLGLSAGAMWALQVGRREETGTLSPVRVAPGHAALLLLLSAAAGFLLTTVLFAATPRVGIGHLMRRTGRPAGLSGFSGTISLRDVTAVKADRRVVARVEFPAPDGGARARDLYLKGASYSLFDGSRWTRREVPRVRVARSGFHYPIAAPLPGDSPSAAEITLEPMDHSALFVYGDPVSVEGNLGDVFTDGRGSYFFAQPSHPTVRYMLRYSGGSPRRTLPPPDLAEEHLGLPEGWDDVRELAARVTSAGRTDAERADLARRFFLSGFRYTVSDPASSAREFLFAKKAGFCEHYATALAILLRAAGIPARVAAGYLGGEWNDVGRYLIVRQADAHAWTEAWIGGRWATLDATPPAGEGSPFHVRTGRIGMYLDWARQRWNKYVVNYSLQMQAEAVAGGWSALRSARSWSWGAAGAAGSLRRAASRLAPALLPAAAALLLLLGIRRRRAGNRAAGAPGETPLPRPYARLFRRLDARGHRRTPGTPPGETLLAAARLRPSLAPDAARFLDLYHRDRFGPRPLSPEESAEAARLAARLRRDLPRAGAA